MIAKLILRNFRRFEDVTIDFRDGLNVIVGDNEAGKTTLLETINLGLTKRWNGKYFDSEFSHHFITASVADRYVAGVKAGEAPRNLSTFLRQFPLRIIVSKQPPPLGVQKQHITARYVILEVMTIPSLTQDEVCKKVGAVHTTVNFTTISSSPSVRGGLESEST